MRFVVAVPDGAAWVDDHGRPCVTGSGPRQAGDGLAAAEGAAEGDVVEGCEFVGAEGGGDAGDEGNVADGDAMGTLPLDGGCF